MREHLKGNDLPLRQDTTRRSWRTMCVRGVPASGAHNASSSSNGVSLIPSMTCAGFSVLCISAPAYTTSVRIGASPRQGPRRTSTNSRAGKIRRWQSWTSTRTPSRTSSCTASGVSGQRRSHRRVGSSRRMPTTSDDAARRADKRLNGARKLGTVGIVDGVKERGRAQTSGGVRRLGGQGRSDRRASARAQVCCPMPYQARSDAHVSGFKRF